MSADAADHNQASQAYDQPTSAEHKEQAAKLGQDNPQWLVIWGTFSHEFVAFPLFRVPQGTILCCRSGPELVRRMGQTEEIYGGGRDA